MRTKFKVGDWVRVVHHCIDDEADKCQGCEVGKVCQVHYPGGVNEQFEYKVDFGEAGSCFFYANWLVKLTEDEKVLWRFRLGL